MSWKLILLTHWGRVMHICNSKLKIIGSDNGLSPDRRQAIIWTNAVIFSIWPLGTNFSEISIEMHTFSFKKMHWKMLSTKWWPFCLSLNVLKLLPHLPVANELIFKLLRITRILEHQDPFYLNGSTLSLAWISNNIHNMYKVWDEITYPFTNYNSSAIEVWEWIGNFIPQFTGHMTAYPYWD